MRKGKCRERIKAERQRSNAFIDSTIVARTFEETKLFDQRVLFRAVVRAESNELLSAFGAALLAFVVI